MKLSAQAATSCWVTCLRIAFIRRVTSGSSASYAASSAAFMPLMS